MLIVCPTCASQYTIDADRVGPTGRVVRCAACREPWFIHAAMASAEPAASEPARDEPIAIVTDRPSSRASSRRGAARLASASREGAGLAGLAAACLLVAIVSAVAFRRTLVHILPESAVVFASIGLPVNLVGLDLAGFRSNVTQGGTGRVLTVAGDIENPSTRTIGVPRLAIAIEGGRGETLYDWTEAPAEAELKPHMTTRFEAHLASPPPEGRLVVVRFSTGEAAPTVASR